MKWLRSGFPKRRLKWREPRAFVRLRDASEARATKWWHRVVVVVVVSGSIMPLWFLAIRNPAKDPPSFEVAVLLALGLGVFMGDVAPRLNRLAPSEVRILDNGCLRTRGQRNVMHNWEDVRGFDFGQVGPHPVIEIHLLAGDVLLLGIGGGPEPSEILACLKQMGVQRLGGDRAAGLE